MNDIRRSVQSSIIFALEQDLKCGELLMKETWEQCETDEDIATAKQELSAIIEDIRVRQRAAAYVVPSRAETTVCLVEAFATYPISALLDELVTCTVRYNLGDLAGEEQRIATALVERLATLGIARKEHRAGCEIWVQHRLCRCPWGVLA